RWERDFPHLGGERRRVRSDLRRLVLRQLDRAEPHAALRRELHGGESGSDGAGRRPSRLPAAWNTRERRRHWSRRLPTVPARWAELHQPPRLLQQHVFSRNLPLHSLTEKEHLKTSLEDGLEAAGDVGACLRKTIAGHVYPCLRQDRRLKTPVVRKIGARVR